MRSECECAASSVRYTEQITLGTAHTVCTRGSRAMSALWSYLLITVCLLHQLLAEPQEVGDSLSNGNTEDTTVKPTNGALCRKPNIGDMGYITEVKEYYNMGESLTVQCKPGYYSPLTTIRCANPGTSQEWTPPTVTCTAQCRRPTIGNVQRLSDDKEYYNKGDSVTVQCKSGYYPSSDTMRCNNPRTPQEWTPPTVTCTALCKKSTMTNLEIVSDHKEYYNRGEEVTVQCKPGYNLTITKCDNPRTSQEGTIHTISCTAQCQKAKKNVKPAPNKNSKNVEEVTNQCKAGYYLSLITIKCDNPLASQQWTPPTVTCPVPDKPKIVKVPSMEDNKIRWKLDNGRGTITGFQVR
ncbi:complement receptor type 1-like [Pyxicephalus adspersus]|uniref:complement receptor type 1-like n=1 Tax=Pyxicephalus adspersus TaxID=30357 RepID=UPI003B59FFB6